jgi:hypothetical protein
VAVGVVIGGEKVHEIVGMGWIMMGCELEKKTNPAAVVDELEVEGGFVVPGFIVVVVVALAA